MSEQEWRLILRNFATALVEHTDNPASDLQTNVARLRGMANLLDPPKEDRMKREANRGCGHDSTYG